MKGLTGRAGRAGRTGRAGPPKLALDIGGRMWIARAGWTALALALMTSPGIAATKAIRAGRLVDASGKVTTNAIIVVDNDRITSVSTGAPPRPADRPWPATNIRGPTILPMLMRSRIA